MTPIEARINSLSPYKLRNIARSLVTACFTEFDEHEKRFWNPDKEINGGDLVEAVVNLLEIYGLIPEHGPFN